MELHIRKWQTNLQVKFVATIILLASTGTGCSSAPSIVEQPRLDEKRIAALIAKEDCRFESFKSTESPDQIVTNFLTRESSGLLHQDQMDWLFQRELCPSGESIADFMYVVTSRSVNLVTHTEILREYQVEYESKGTLLVLNDESQEMTLRWDEKESKLTRKISIYKTEYGWKMSGPLFSGGEHLSPQSVATLYAKKISPDFKYKLSSWVK